MLATGRRSEATTATVRITAITPRDRATGTFQTSVRSILAPTNSRMAARPVFR
jgi:hypothetical protein